MFDRQVSLPVIPFLQTSRISPPLVFSVILLCQSPLPIPLVTFCSFQIDCGLLGLSSVYLHIFGAYTGLAPGIPLTNT